MDFLPLNTNPDFIYGAGGAGRRGGDHDKLMEACREFEGILMSQMFSTMMSQTGMKSNFLPETAESGMYRQMLNDEIAQSAARQGGFGLAGLLYRQFTGKAPEAEAGP